MRIMHECNEDVLIGMNSSYCRESQKHPELVYRVSDHYKMSSSLYYTYTLLHVTKIEIHLFHCIINTLIIRIIYLLKNSKYFKLLIKNKNKK